MVISRGSGAYLEFLEWLEVLGIKRKGPIQNLGIFQGFCGILEGLGPICD
jgi:hypothetical protein